MENGKVVLLGFARPGFDTDLALRMLEESAARIEQLGFSVLRPEGLVTDPDEAGRVAAGYRQADAAAAVLQFSTFGDGRFLTNVASQLDLPLLLWSVPEPEVGARLRLNSLTGVNLAGSLLVRLGRRFKYVYRLPGDTGLVAELAPWLRAAGVARALRGAVIAEVGNPPPGFYTSTVDPLALMKTIGARLIRIDLQTVLQRAGEVPVERYGPLLEADRAAVKGLDALAPDQVIRSTQLRVALRDALGPTPPDAVAVRCWPELFTDYRAVACSTLSHLIEEGIPAACEADTLGAITMLVQHRLTGQPTYLGDLVHVDRERNTCVFWHCGVGAFSLASPRTGPVAGVQPNRNLGFALNNGLKSGSVTIARIGQTGDGFRLLVLGGEALDEPNRFRGTSVEVRVGRPVQEILDAVMYGGFEHHYAVVWADVAAELVELAGMLGVPCVRL